MSRDLLLKLGCLVCAALLLMAVAGCGKKGDPRPPAQVTAVADSTPCHSRAWGNHVS